MSKNIYLHLFVALLVLDWSQAFTSRLLEERDRHIPEKHHATRRHASRHNTRYLDRELEAEPSSTVHRYTRKDMIQDNIQEVFDLNENPEGSRQVVKRESSGPTFHQSNSVPGAYINNYFHQFPANQQPQQYPTYLPQQVQQYPAYQPQQVQQYPAYQPQPLNIPYNPFGFGLAPIFLCLCCYQQPKVPQTNLSNNGSGVSLDDRFTGDGIGAGDNEVNTNQIGSNNGNYNPNINQGFDFGQFVNTSTGISLEIVPPRRNDSRRPPPIAHGIESNAIVPPYNPPRPAPTQGPIFQQTPPTARPLRPITQRPIIQRPTTRRPAPSNPRTDRTSCAVAILQCCSNNRYNERCFSARGCPGPFFDNPCTSALALEASKFLNSDSLFFSD